MFLIMGAGRGGFVEKGPMMISALSIIAPSPSLQQGCLGFRVELKAEVVLLARTRASWKILEPKTWFKLGLKAWGLGLN